MSRKSFPDGLPREKLIRLAEHVLDGGRFDIVVDYEGVENFRDEGPVAWSRNDWLNAARLWCHPFVASETESRPFSLTFPSDERAVEFLITL